MKIADRCRLGMFLVAMGFYPVNPAEGIYILGKPMVEKAEISIGDKPFKVKTVGWSDENIYVQSVKLNGRAYNKLFIYTCRYSKWRNFRIYDEFGSG